MYKAIFLSAHSRWNWLAEHQQQKKDLKQDPEKMLEQESISLLATLEVKSRWLFQQDVVLIQVDLTAPALIARDAQFLG